MRDYRITFKLDSIINFDDPFTIDNIKFFYSDGILLAQTVISSDNPMQPQRIANEKLTRICSAISYLFKHPLEFHIHKVEILNEDGTVRADMNTFEGTLYVRQKLSEANLNDINKITKLMYQKGNVNSVMRLINRHDFKTWKILYNIFEIIDHDVNIIKKGWISKKKINLFTQTANNPKASGLEARHGFQKTEPPKVPMKLEEAVDLINNLVNNWLESLLVKESENLHQ